MNRIRHARAAGLALLLAALTGAAPAGAAPNRGVVELDVLYTSDVHGHVDRGKATFLSPEFPPVLGGSATAATYVAAARERAAAAGRRVLLFDSGDLFQGTPVSAHTRGGVVIEWMNRIGYDAATVGNHDFDLGRENAERLARMAKFPILAANLYESDSGARPAWVRDHAVFDVDGIAVAVLGYITESTVQMAFEKNVAGLEFRRIVDCLPDDVRRVRAAGADLVFVLLHHGMPYRGELEGEYARMVARDSAGDLRHFGMDAMELARAVPGVDAYFAGHTHQGFDRPWEDPVTHALVFEPYANGSSLGHVTFRIDRATRQLIGYRTHFDRGALLTLLEDEVWPDSLEASVMARAVEVAERGLDEVIARTRVPLRRGPAGESLLGFLIADAFREELGADIAFQNTGGVRGDLRPGPITARDLLEIAPFGNTMVLARLDGATLRGLVEDRLRGRAGGVFVSGAEVRFDLARPEGDRLVGFTIGGAPVDDARVYAVAMTDYLAEGNSGFDRLARLPSERFAPFGFTDREVLTRWLRRRGTVEPKQDGRWQQVKGAAVPPAGTF
jgi:5'-nucleotidase / UDP-sugar diphosphatase